jgi:ABC-type transport system involved in multi-copper enzyme maturation permease subunit
VSGYLSLVLNGFRESRRNRVTLVVGIFAIIMVAASVLVTQVTVATFERVLVDVGLGFMSLILVMLAIFLSSGLLAREIERRTIFLVVSKPITRGGFIFARCGGVLLTLFSLELVMAALLLVEVKAYGYNLGAALPVACGMLLVELLVTVAIGFFFSSFLNVTLSAICTLGVYMAGQFGSDLYRLSSKVRPVASAVLRGAYYLLPNFERLNYRPYATYQTLPAMEATLGSLAYGLAYALGLLLLAAMLFDRRDFR